MVVFSLLKKNEIVLFDFLSKILLSLVVMVVIPVFHHLLFILQQFKATR